MVAAAAEEDQTFAEAAIDYSTCTLNGSDGSVDLMAETGMQMGFTLAPAAFHDAYNPKVARWFNDLRESDITYKLLDTWLQTNATYPELPLQLAGSTCMDDVTQVHVWPSCPGAPEAMERLSAATALLELRLAEGNWTLNASKTGHLNSMMGTDSMRTTKQLLKESGQGLNGLALREMRVLGPY